MTAPILWYHWSTKTGGMMYPEGLRKHIIDGWVQDPPAAGWEVLVNLPKLKVGIAAGNVIVVLWRN